MAEIKDPIYQELDRMIAKCGSKQACAEALDIHPSYLSEIIHRKAPVPPRVFEQLGYMKITVHVKSERALAVVRAIEKAVAA